MKPTYYIIAIALVFVALASHAFDPTQVRGTVRSIKLPPRVKAVALTFDLCESAGETSGFDRQIVDYLAANDVKATFFAGGKWMRSHPAQTKELLANANFQMGNHSWSHKNFRIISDKLAERELKDAEDAFKELSGAKSMELFRFPFGACDDNDLDLIQREGKLAIQWSIVTGDPSPATSSDGIAQTVISQVKPGAIIICHANGKGVNTAEALGIFVPALRARGYEFVTVGELLKMGEPVIASTCYELRPGDNLRYDRKVEHGTKNSK